MDEYLALFPELHSRALETLWKLDYDLDMARESMLALASDAAQGIQDPAEPLHLDRVTPIFSDETRARFLEGMALHGEEWAKVKAFMGHSHSIGNLQDYFYGVLCTASHAPLRADVQRRYKAILRAKEAAERRERERKLKEEAKIRAAETKEREEREKEEREREEREREQLRAEDASFSSSSSSALAASPPFPAGDDTSEWGGGSVGMDLDASDDAPGLPQQQQESEPPHGNESAAGVMGASVREIVQNGALNGHECIAGPGDGDGDAASGGL